MDSQSPLIEVFCFASGGILGTLAPLIKARGIAYRQHLVKQVEDVPSTLPDASAVIIMGGPMSVNDPLPWIPPLLQLLKRTIDSDTPVLGICLGSQLMASALGAKVFANPHREMGWGSVRWASPISSGKGLAKVLSLSAHAFPELPVFHFHGETFEIPVGAQALLTSSFCANQGFTINKSLALQCHIEPDANMITDWAKKEAPLIPDPSRPCMQTQDIILCNLPGHIATLKTSIAALIIPWLDQISDPRQLNRHS
jgi:GMP synthase-like glutamine amidotransferase